MKYRLGISAICAVTIFVCAEAAGADTPRIYNGMTLQQFVAVLDELGYRSTQESSASGPYLSIAWPNSQFRFNGGAIGCGPNGVCDGFIFVAENKVTTPTADTIASMNEGIAYVKFIRTAQGRAVASLEHVVQGGIVKENVASCLNAFVDGLAAYSKKAGGQIAAAPAGGASMSLGGEAATPEPAGHQGFGPIEERSEMASLLSRYARPER